MGCSLPSFSRSSTNLFDIFLLIKFIIVVQLDEMIFIKFWKFLYEGDAIESGDQCNAEVASLLIFHCVPGEAYAMEWVAESMTCC